MAGFLYFVSGAKAATAEVVGGVGLSDVFAGVGAEGRDIAEGPDGSAGVVFCVVGSGSIDARRLRVDLEAQTWRDCGAFWLGYYTDAKPGPADLCRTESPGGWPLALTSSAALWVVSPASALPRVYDIDGGEWFARLDDREARLSAMTDRFFEAWRFARGEIEFEPAAIAIGDECDACVEALALNYRVGRNEVAALGLLTDLGRALIRWALMDVLDVVNSDLDDAKKNDVSQSGERAVSPADLA